MVKPQPGPGPAKYKLPPLVGFRDHDASRIRNPQYSIRQQLTIIDKRVSPGPKYNYSGITQYGKEHKPAFTLISRPTPLKPFLTPSPLAYKVEQVPPMKEARAPAYSIVSRPRPLREPDYPGPNKYKLPSTLGPKVPDLPAKGAYTIAQKYDLICKDKSPGPAKYPPVPVNTVRHRQPKYSIKGKPIDVEEKFPGPGPAEHFPQFKHEGGYSFGLRTDNAPYILPDDQMPCVRK